MIARIHQFFRDEDAATSVEYAVMLMLIAAVCLVAIQSVGVGVGNVWGDNNNGIGEVLGDLDD